MTMASAEDRRRELAKKAWAEAYSRLGATGGFRHSPATATRAILDAERDANDATAGYILGNSKANPRDKLSKWERMMAEAIKMECDQRGCDDCGIEKVAEVVDKDGHRSCGRCRSGQR
jgi:hypothetical protein